MADEHETGAEDRAPLLTETAASQTVPILTDAVVETAVPALQDDGGRPDAGPSEETLASLRDTLTVLARELTRECLDEILDEARQTLERRLETRFEERLVPLIEQALREHLEPRG
jgi:hypothetical protein